MAPSDPANPGGGRILLATDLSARCDRALDRACALAEAWDATLHVVTAVEADAATAAAVGAAARTEAEAELADAIGERPVRRQVEVVAGRPDAVICEAARRLKPDLIVVGVARNEILGRMRPGRTVEALVREACAPFLVVKRRTRGPYGQVLVPTDFSPAAEQALVRAAAMFPEAAFTLLHAYRVPFTGFLSESEHDAEMRAMALEDQQAFVERVQAEAGRPLNITPRVEYGGPDERIDRFLRDHAPDLMVLGAHARGGLLERLAPDVAGRLLMAAACDVLVVPERSGARAAPSRTQTA